MRQFWFSALVSTESPESGSRFWQEFGTQSQRNHRKVASTDLAARTDVDFISPNAFQQYGLQTVERRPSIYCPRAEQVRSRHEDRFSWRWSNRGRVCASRVHHENASLCGERGHGDTAPLHLIIFAVMLTSHDDDFSQLANSLLQEIMFEGLPIQSDLPDK